MAVECFYSWTIPSIKISILFLYRRIFPQKWLKKCDILFGAIVVLSSLASFLGFILQCVPLDVLWDPTVSASCLDLRALILATGVCNLITDLLIFGLPIYPLWKLKASKAKRLQLIGVFTVGAL